MVEMFLILHSFVFVFFFPGNLDSC